MNRKQQHELLALIIRIGYTNNTIGYIKDTETVRHCIIFLAEGSIMMWGYKRVGGQVFDGQPKSIYNTGLLFNITEPDFRVLISTFLKEHN